VLVVDPEIVAGRNDVELDEVVDTAGADGIEELVEMVELVEVVMPYAGGVGLG